MSRARGGCRGRWRALVAVSVAVGAGVCADSALARSSRAYGSGPGYCTSYAGGVTSRYSFENVYACQGTTTGATTFDNPGSGVYAWQCVELSTRFASAVYGLSVTGVPYGYQFVSVAHAEHPAISVGSPGPGHVPAPGDIVSMGPGGPTDPTAGHTAVVVSSDPIRGRFTVMSENVPVGRAGEQTWQVDLRGGHNGSAETGGQYEGVSWLNLVSPSPPVSGSPLAATGDGRTGEVQLAAATGGGRVYRSLRSAHGRWQKWLRMWKAPTGVRAVAATGDGRAGEVQFVVATGGGALYRSLRTARGRSQEWHRMWNAPTGVRAVAATTDGRVGEVQFVVATDRGEVYRSVRSPDGTWRWLRFWHAPAGVRAVAATGDGRRGELQLVVATGGGVVYRSTRSAHGSWRWHRIWRAPAGVRALAATGDRRPGEVQFAVVTDGGALFRSVRPARGSWRWRRMWKAPAGVRAVAVTGDGRVGEVQFVVATDGGEVFRDLRTAHRGEQRWRRMRRAPAVV